MFRISISPTIACVVAVLFSLGASAQSTERERQAEQLFEEAQDAMRRQAWAAACDKFTQSQRLDPQLGTQLHLADCYEKLGRRASAWLNFRAAAALAVERNGEGRAETREEVAKRRMQALEPMLATLRLRVASAQPPDLSIACDGRVLARSAWNEPKPLDAGLHVLVARAAGYKTWVKTWFVADGVRYELEVPMQLAGTVESPPGVAPPMAADRPPRDQSSQRNSDGRGTWSVAAYVTGAAGIALLGAGLVTMLTIPGLPASTGEASCPSSDRACLAVQSQLFQEYQAKLHSEEHAADLARARMWLFYAGGGILLATGATLLILRPGTPSATTATLRLAPAYVALTLRTDAF